MCEASLVAAVEEKLFFSSSQRNEQQEISGFPSLACDETKAELIWNMEVIFLSVESWQSLIRGRNYCLQTMTDSQHHHHSHLTSDSSPKRSTSKVIVTYLFNKFILWLDNTLSTAAILTWSKLVNTDVTNDMNECCALFKCRVLINVISYTCVYLLM